MFRTFAKNRAIKQYLRKLPPALRSRYGASRTYSAGQVRTTVGSLGLSQRHIEFAYLLFCTQEILRAQGMQQEQMDDLSSYLNQHNLLGGAGWEGALGGAFPDGGAGFDGGGLGGGLGGGGDGGV